MNLILFEPTEIDRPLPRTDPRARHILDVLRRQPGGTFDAGLINGPLGRATLEEITAGGLALTFAWEAVPPAADALTLIVGLPRPQTARDILRDATTLGVAELHFVRTAKSEPGYAQSTLWTSGEARRHLVTGAGQAFTTRIPELTHTRDLSEALVTLPSPSARLALDNYESSVRLGECDAGPEAPQVLAVGGERGWSAEDRDLLRQHQFTLVHLGHRVLRTETATVAALAILRMKRGLM